MTPQSPSEKKNHLFALACVYTSNLVRTFTMSSPEDIQKKIDELEAEMARTQKNKATNYHLVCVTGVTCIPGRELLDSNSLILLLSWQGTLKAKIAKLKSELVNGPGGKQAGTKNAERGFDVTKSGDTRIGLVGFPSVGKSTLLTTLTGTRSEAAAYEFTTLTCIPGTMKYKGARIQVRHDGLLLSKTNMHHHITLLIVSCFDCCRYWISLESLRAQRMVGEEVDKSFRRLERATWFSSC